MPAKKIESTTLICARLPGKCPTMVRESVHQPVGDAADIHQVGGEQEERHREQDEGIVGVEGLLHRASSCRDAARSRESAGRRAPSANATGTRRNIKRKKQPNRMSAACPGDSTAPVMTVLPKMILRSSSKLLAEKDNPGRAGDRPGDVDEPERQIGKLRGAVPGELGELDAGRDEDEAIARTPRRPSMRAKASHARRTAAARHRPRNACSRARRSWRRS